MPLRSMLFAGHKRLEACSKNHPDHITPGAMGDHVHLIQLALRRLDGAFISPAELHVGLYGASTAKAVLAYKQKRKIINHSYQSTADDIVGIMTIARMDEDLLKLQGTNRHVAICPACRTEPHAPAATAVPRGPRLAFSIGANTVGDGKGKPQIGGVVRVHIQWVVSLAEKGISFPIQDQVEKARNMLGEFGISLVTENGSKPQAIAFLGGTRDEKRNWSNEVITDDDREDLYRASLRSFPHNDRVYRVIICTMGATSHFADTYRDIIVDGRRLPKFTLMNARMVDANGITFLHEMIHAAYKDLQDHDREPESVFYKHSDESGRPSRDVPIVQYLLKEKHARAIAQSYFGIGGR